MNPLHLKLCLARPTSQRSSSKVKEAARRAPRRGLPQPSGRRGGTARPPCNIRGPPAQLSSRAARE
eukprot:5949138-Pyramimonas_sp.AAC.1